MSSLPLFIQIIWEHLRAISKKIDYDRSEWAGAVIFSITFTAFVMFVLEKMGIVK